MKTVWTFTNKKELNKSEFINYFERKVFRTIRKYKMLPEDKIFTLKNSKDLNTIILNKILETKFQVRLVPSTYHLPPTTSASNLSQAAEDIFREITKGNFGSATYNLQPTTSKAPLLYLSDPEVELYAKLKKIKGTPRKQDKKIQNLFQKFLPKNQDLEINILNAQNQITQTK